MHKNLSDIPSALTSLLRAHGLWYGMGEDSDDLQIYPMDDDSPMSEMDIRNLFNTTIGDLLAANKPELLASCDPTVTTRGDMQSVSLHAAEDAELAALPLDDDAARVTALRTFEQVAERRWEAVEGRGVQATRDDFVSRETARLMVMSGMSKPTIKPRQYKRETQYISRLMSCDMLADGDPSSIDIDADDGVIKGIAIACIGPVFPSAGTPCYIDAQALQQIADLGNAMPDGVPCRFTHGSVDAATGQDEDDLGRRLGKIKNFRLDGDTVRGDLFIAPAASNLPGLGNVAKYVMDLAGEDPSDLGISLVSQYAVVQPAEPMDLEGTQGLMRLLSIHAADVVGAGAATPNGLLRSKP